MKRFGRGVSIYLFQSFMRSPLIHLTLFHSLGVLLLCNNVLVSVFLLLMTLIEKNRELAAAAAVRISNVQGCALTAHWANIKQLFLRF